MPDILSMDQSENTKIEGGRRVRGHFKTSGSQSPLITVITVVYNGEQYLEETIQSVIHQTYENVEYVIIDGGSTDGTLDIIQKYDDQIDYWVSEKDQGIYDAMNKGIDAAGGDYLYFLGADDRLYDEKVLYHISKKLALKDVDFIFGSIITNQNKIVRSTISSKIFLHNSIHHQSCFYAKKLFLSFRYDTTLKAISDYELNLFARLQKYKYAQTDRLIAFCRDGGISTSEENFNLFITETNKIRKKLLPKWINFFAMMVFYSKTYFYAIKKHS